MPSGRVITPSVPVTPVPAWGATPFAATNGGQMVKQLPVQALTPGVSFLKIYNVIPLLSTRNVPRLVVDEVLIIDVDIGVSATVGVVPAAGVLVAAAYVGLAAAVVGVAAAVVGVAAAVVGVAAATVGVAAATVGEAAAVVGVAADRVAVGWLALAWQAVRANKPIKNTLLNKPKRPFDIFNRRNIHSSKVVMVSP